MITAKDVKEKLHIFLTEEINQLSNNTPLIAFFKPIIDRIINSNLDRLDNMLELLANDKGHIDVKGILTEMTTSLINSNPFKLDTGLGDITIGNGLVKMDVPFTGKSITLNTDDIARFRQMFV